ncbi:MAG TPA: hypothetical protein VEY12_05120 [Thermoplasmata archaeon]|nr:hypothetical protein [Thermoplasmata archaeon]
MPANAWRCGECGAVLPDTEDTEAHFRSHPVPSAAVLAPRCTHAPLVVDVTPERVYLWMSAEAPGGWSLSLHHGWPRWHAPSVIREIVERENGASLATPGWYYPHTRASAEALDGLYHEIARSHVAARARTRVSAPRMPAPVKSALWTDARRARRTRLTGSLELTVGIVVAVSGGTLMYACTAYDQFGGCAEHGFGLPGFFVLVAGLVAVLLGLSSLMAATRKGISEMPEGWTPKAASEDAKAYVGVERTAAWLWGGILLAILVAAEAIPIYGVVGLTTAGQHPTFNLGAFVVDMVFIAVADLFVVFLIVTQTANT